MKKVISKIVTFSLITLAVSAQAQNASELIDKVVAANGGKKALHKLKDVSLDYTFRVQDNNTVDISKERYIFNKEISFATYSKREVYVLPQLPGTTLTQFFNGENTVSKIDGKVITDQQAASVGHIFRKTNYYWFAMMFKLNDPGVHHKLLPARKVNDITYKVVEMTFADTIGESSKDRYILYINPETFRVDQFLYNATGFGVTEPNLVKVRYEEIDGVYLTTYRKYASADWDGKVKIDFWTEQLSKNVQFNNGYDLETIQK